MVSNISTIKIVYPTFLILIVLSLITIFSNVRLMIDGGYRSLGYCNVSKQHELNVAIVIEPLKNTNLKKIGGIGHWYHLLERVIHVLESAEVNIWNHPNANQRDLYIVFYEKDSVEGLNSFCRFILTSILSGNRYKRVVFGYSENIGIISDHNSTSLIETKMFHKTFVVDLHKMYTTDRFVVSDDNDDINSYNSCFLLLSQVKLSRVQNRMGEWFKTLSSYNLFRKISNQVCNLPDRGDTNETIVWSNSSSLDDISKLSEPVLKNRINNKLKKMSMSVLTSSPIVYNSHKTILIYQRDQSRLLSLGNTKKCTNRGSAENIANCIKMLLFTSHANISKNIDTTWSMEVMSHSDNRSPCVLIEKISSTTVLITPHGFQSILLLFQPLSSLLVEIYPFMYFKPDLYGFIQVGLRQRFLIARSYLCEETLPFNIVHHVIEGIQRVCGFTRKFCTNNFLCKLIVRNQNTHISEDTIIRVINFVNEHFP